MKDLEIKSQLLEVKATGEDGEFEGYAATFGNVDSVDDVIKPTAFDKYLSQMGSTLKAPKMLWQHRREEVIGVYTEIRKDEQGLFVKGKLALGTAKGREAYELLKIGAIDSMSIGFFARDYEIDRANGLRFLTEIELFEISLVTFPANESAKVGAVKGERLTERDFETVLRDAGLSRKEAKAFIAEGFDGYSQRDADGLADLKKLFESIK